MTQQLLRKVNIFWSYGGDNEWDTGVVSGAVLDEDDNGYAILGGIHT